MKWRKPLVAVAPAAAGLCHLTSARVVTPMLILTRRAGESLCIGDNIKVTVLSVQGKQVKIGLDIPDKMLVFREEVYLRIKEQNRQASETLDTDLLLATELWKSKKK